MELDASNMHKTPHIHLDNLTFLKKIDTQRHVKEGYIFLQHKPHSRSLYLFVNAIYTHTIVW